MDEAAPGPVTARPPTIDGAVDEVALGQIFRAARTPRRFGARPVAQSTLAALYDLVRLGPTSGNSSPARFVFLTSEDAKARLAPALSTANSALCALAPVIVIVCHDPLFFETLPRLNAEAGLRDWFAADVGLSDETAFRNGTLQGGYLILAARALGLAAAPMSGFDPFLVEDALLPSTGWRANFLVALGYPDDDTALPPRAARLDFDEACRTL